MSSVCAEALFSFQWGVGWGDHPQVHSLYKVMRHRMADAQISLCPIVVTQVEIITEEREARKEGLMCGPGLFPGQLGPHWVQLSFHYLTVLPAIVTSSGCGHQVPLSCYLAVLDPGPSFQKLDGPSVRKIPRACFAVLLA